MDKNTFETIIEEQIKRSKEVLLKKEDEYAVRGDRLHNFKVASDLQGISIESAIAGMMSKHTVSVYDMCMDKMNYPISTWNEKITDHINYLLILRAAIETNTIIYADDGPYMTIRNEEE